MPSAAYLRQIPIDMVAQAVAKQIPIDMVAVVAREITEETDRLLRSALQAIADRNS